MQACVPLGFLRSYQSKVLTVGRELRYLGASHWKKGLCFQEEQMTTYGAHCEYC